jgi:tripartite motif-containing protein 71
VDGSGSVYVTDTYNDRVQSFTGTGTYLTQWGGFGSGLGQFYHPMGVAAGADGRIYVSEEGTPRIQIFTGSGSDLDVFGSYSSGDGQFMFSVGMVVDASGKVVVADTYNHRIQVFNSLPVPTQSTSWGRIKTLYR